MASFLDPHSSCSCSPGHACSCSGGRGRARPISSSISALWDEAMDDRELDEESRRPLVRRAPAPRPPARVPVRTPQFRPPAAVQVVRAAKWNRTLARQSRLGRGLPAITSAIGAGRARPGSPAFALALARTQRRLGLRPAGLLTPRTIRAIMEMIRMRRGRPRPGRTVITNPSPAAPPPPAPPQADPFAPPQPPPGPTGADAGSADASSDAPTDAEPGPEADAGDSAPAADAGGDDTSAGPDAGAGGEEPAPPEEGGDASAGEPAPESSDPQAEFALWGRFGPPRTPRMRRAASALSPWPTGWTP